MVVIDIQTCQSAGGGGGACRRRVVCVRVCAVLIVMTLYLARGGPFSPTHPPSQPHITMSPGAPPAIPDDPEADPAGSAAG